MVKFIQGRALSQQFFTEVVQGLLKKHYPTLKYSAGLLGPGSDVIGFDTARSMDHDWGPRVLLFLSESDFKKKQQIDEMLSKELPYSFKGFSTHFGPPDEQGVKISQKIERGKIRHRVEIYTIRSFFKQYLNVDINQRLSAQDWLVFPEHKLLTISGEKLFYDKLQMVKVLSQFIYYPKDVWYYLLACQWARIGQEEHFMGRCGELGDEIGSKIVAVRLVKDIMKLCFLLEKKYTPYIKWFGSGFKQLKASKTLALTLKKILASTDWKTREQHLSKAYQYLALQHNGLKITKPMPTRVALFHDRPFLVIEGEKFAAAIRSEIKDPAIKKIKVNFGSVNQFSDSTDLMESNTQKLKAIYK